MIISYHRIFHWEKNRGKRGDANKFPPGLAMAKFSPEFTPTAIDKIGGEPDVNRGLRTRTSSVARAFSPILALFFRR